MAAEPSDIGGARDLTALFAAEMGALLGPEFPKKLSLAVSGGGDSMAMLYLAAPWARVMGIGLEVLTVNHHLREEAVEEVALVACACAELGLEHVSLAWHWDGQGNLAAAARRGRYGAMADHGVRHLLLAHTQDDQAETFLMNLARGSGVDGLSAMAPLSHRGTMIMVRPLLGVTRAELRHYLKVLRIEYADDPSNDDPRYDRVKMRRVLPSLAELGLTPERLATTANAMGRAREALGRAALEVHEAALVDEPGAMLFDVVYDRDVLATAPRELQLRLLAAALQYVSQSETRPRLAPLGEALDRALAGGATTLHGGYVLPHRERLYICAELATVADLRPAQGLWRGRYKIENKDVCVLGEVGAAQLRHLTDLPARVLWPCPAVWDGDKVLSTPRLGANAHWNPAPDRARYLSLLTSR